MLHVAGMFGSGIPKIPFVMGIPSIGGGVASFNYNTIKGGFVNSDQISWPTLGLRYPRPFEMNDD